MRDVVLDHLGALVGRDTANPPRAIDAQSGAPRYVADALDRAGFSVEIADLGDGCVNVSGRRGAPDVLVQCHLDTVPAAAGWSTPPHELVVDADAARGLGACDVKGAAACVLAAAGATRGDAAVLFSTDEEAGTARCVRAAATRPPAGIAAVLVCEPTGCRLVREHRGILSLVAKFAGDAGHASARHRRSALHDACRWCAQLLDDELAAAALVNVGRLEGGTKANVVAERAEVAVGLRPPPEVDPDELVERLRVLAPAGARLELRERFRGPALAATPAGELADRLGIAMGGRVDFWTEASLFAEAGMPAAVFGPGNIAHAHAADERVELTELDAAAATYARLFGA